MEIMKGKLLISEEYDKVDEYLAVIQSRIVDPIQKSDMAGYCTAVLLLLFAAMDGLGKLIHDNDRAGSNQRIRAFLDYMNNDYKKRKQDLLSLRHSLVHNAINVASFMTHTEMDSDQHLKRIGSGGFIYVNTTIMYHDFIRAFEKLREGFKNDGAKMARAAQRLAWRDDDANDKYLDNPSTPPPSVEFIWAK